MQWLGIAFPRWLENDLRHARDPLETSLALCERVCAEAWEYARAKDIPLGSTSRASRSARPRSSASTELARTPAAGHAVVMI
jgi:hypothetical protein